MLENANVVKTITCLATVATLIGGCAVESSSPTPAPRAGAPAQRPAQTKIDTAQGERIKRIMVPLIAAMDKPRDLKQIKMGVMDDPSINAANAGNGEFFVTTGLLQKANDNQLAGVLAHEVAHEDLGHVAKAKALGAGLNIGMVILDQIIPGSTLLGFLNADHWAIAVPVNRSHPVISRRLVDKNDYPREALLEAVLRFIEDDLDHSQ